MWVPVKRGFSHFLRRDWMGSRCVLDTGKRNEGNGCACPSWNWVMKQSLKLSLEHCVKSRNYVKSSKQSLRYADFLGDVKCKTKSLLKRIRH